jgi:hypothetical protein
MECNSCGVMIKESLWRFCIEANKTKHPLYEIMEEQQICAQCAKIYFEAHEEEYETWQK